MKRVMRQVFGSSRPKDIWLDMLTFDRLNTRALIHIVYWAGLSLLIIAAFGVLGVAVGNALSDNSPMAYLLSLPMLVVGWLAILIGMIVWRVLCGFILSVMGIGEDLRALRQMQEQQGGLAMSNTLITPFAPEVDAPEVDAPEVDAPKSYASEADAPAPFSEAARARPSRKKSVESAADTVAPEPVESPTAGENILEDPFFRPRFAKPEN
ncbi:DUF4282 domain-containing protein [Asticcacaulis sp. EMRT-3]|uniref:DUF4282 domain-containing protein n=1 Tax=Asticcacaulis sp. EMRT-3 TaxID=3040349 RepID=UPI0024AEBBB2|nr:DUF4282 domain-containing protein [Asticcacaulis sp. EMRT-3]MDI7775481.1 DUF4282 domain-containing protein [Asticcacaulis sp. EMRT-3]